MVVTEVSGVEPVPEMAMVAMVVTEVSGVQPVPDMAMGPYWFQRSVRARGRWGGSKREGL